MCGAWRSCVKTLLYSLSFSHNRNSPVSHTCERVWWSIVAMQWKLRVIFCCSEFVKFLETIRKTREICLDGKLTLSVSFSHNFSLYFPPSRWWCEGGNLARRKLCRNKREREIGEGVNERKFGISWHCVSMLRLVKIQIFFGILIFNVRAEEVDLKVEIKEL